MIYINFPIQGFSMTFDDFNAWRDEQINHAMQDRYSLLLYYFINTNKKPIDFLNENCDTLTFENWLRKYITDYMITKYQTYAYHRPENIATTKTLDAAFSVNWKDEFWKKIE